MLTAPLIGNALAVTVVGGNNEFAAVGVNDTEPTAEEVVSPPPVAPGNIVVYAVTLNVCRTPVDKTPEVKVGAFDAATATAGDVSTTT